MLNLRSGLRSLPAAAVAMIAVATIAPDAHAISGAEAVARADEWVAAGMPYCQAPFGGCDSHVCCGSGYRPENPAWDPYRSDCSGLVSWAWNIGGPGRVTTGFAPFNNAISHVIDAADLEAGDAMNSSEHIMLFKAWVVHGSVATFTDEHDWGTLARNKTVNVSISGSSFVRKDWPSNPFIAIRFNGITNCSPEVCNGVDDDCNGQIDENLSQQCGSNVGVCQFGQSACAGGAWGACVGGVGPSDEICDGLDNDCDGAVDDHDVCELDEAMEASLFDIGPSSDVDGDGRADACALSDNEIVCDLSSGHGFDRGMATPIAGVDMGARSVFSTLRVGDIDGDGRADACMREPAGVSCWMSEGHGLGRLIVGPRWSDASGFADPASFSTIRMADIDGDGRADLCARSAAGFACYRATGNGFDQTTTLTLLSDVAGFSDVNRYATLRMGDIDGDGRADVCARTEAGMSCWLSDGNEFSRRIVGPPWSDQSGFSAWRRWSTIRMADVDGDGRADLCARETDGFSCYLSRDGGFTDKVSGPALTDESGWSRPDRLESIRMGDLDGDGSADLCAREQNGMTCFLWSGHGFDRRVNGPALNDEDGWSRPDRYRTLRIADVNGDGQGDLCGRGASGLDCSLFEGGAFGRLVHGPTWSDQSGWSAPPRYETIRVSSRSIPSSIAAQKTRLLEEIARDAPPPACSANSSSGPSRAPVLFIAVAALFAARRRERASSRR